MNASFFPEQLKHCMCGLPEFRKQGRLFLLFCGSALGRLSLVHLDPGASEKMKQKTLHLSE